MPNRYERVLESALRQAMRESPAVFIAGPRQAGKSTLARQARPRLAKASYVTLDDYLNLDQAIASPDAFLSAHGAPVILDEIQRAPRLGMGIKRRIDEARAHDSAGSCGLYLLTGSSGPSTLPQLANSLVGRMRLLTLLPLAATEALGGKAAFWHALRQGPQAVAALKRADTHWDRAAAQATFPELASQEKMDRAGWFQGYLGTLFQRDALEISAIERAPALSRLLKLMASRCGQLLNEASLAKDAGMSPSTAMRYRALLESLSIVQLLPSWQRNLGKRLIKAPKLYLLDLPLQCHLLGLNIHGLARLEPSLLGGLLESFVAIELRKALAMHNSPAGLFYFRTATGHEVDFVIEWPDGGLVAIEVKAQKSLDYADVKGLEGFRALTGASFKGGLVLYLGTEVKSVGPNILAVPLSVLWA